MFCQVFFFTGCLHFAFLFLSCTSWQTVWSLTDVAWLLVGSTFSDICSTRSPTVFKAAAQLDPDQLTFRHLCDPWLQPTVNSATHASRLALYNNEVPVAVW